MAGVVYFDSRAEPRSPGGGRRWSGDDGDGGSLSLNVQSRESAREGAAGGRAPPPATAERRRSSLPPPRTGRNDRWDQAIIAETGDERAAQGFGRGDPVPAEKNEKNAHAAPQRAHRDRMSCAGAQDSDQEGLGGEGEMVARRMAQSVRVSSALLGISSLAHVAGTAANSRLRWDDEEYLFLSRVPCILQPRLEPFVRVTSTISRFVLCTDLVPPAAALVLLTVHLARQQRSTAPSSRALAAIWCWKLLMPVLVYMCVHVKSDHVVIVRGL